MRIMSEDQRKMIDFMAAISDIYGVAQEIMDLAEKLYLGPGKSYGTFEEFERDVEELCHLGKGLSIRAYGLRETCNGYEDEFHDGKEMIL